MKNLLPLSIGLAVLWVFAFLPACVPTAQQTAGGKDPQYYTNKNFRAEDYIYEPNIRTVLFNKANTDSLSLFDFPVLALNEAGSQLRLQFDELGQPYQNYYYKIIACNYDWSPGILMDNEIVGGYNEFIMDSYEISLNTRQPYIHYTANIPQTKISGNFIVKVYRNRDQDDIIITRRFMVYDSKLRIVPEIKFALDPVKRFTDQEIDFTIGYGSLDLINPSQLVKVVVRQNGRWDNAIYNLKPMFIREEDHVLDYHFYNCENCFPGLSEFRFFDTRSIRFNGMGVEKTKFDNSKAEAWLYTEQSRNKPVYNQQYDINGRFIIQNFETQNGAVEADYVFTNFSLETGGRTLPGKVYIFGLLSDWRADKSLEMEWDTTAKKYTARPRLKQGYYNYYYAIAPTASPGTLDNISLEGTYNQTENKYDILVYFRPIGSRYDQLIGYGNWSYYGKN